MKQLVISLVLAAFVILSPGFVQAETAPQSLSDVVKRVAPSVVGITVVKREVSPDPDEPARVIMSSGSGFVIQTDGYILSNAHVLDHALWAEITTSTGKTYPIDPKQIWADPVSDLAVAKVEASFPAATWGDDTRLSLGDPVFVMGAPFGLTFSGSVSRGIVSGINRALGLDYTFIQTDSPINPGNSGGPLFNDRGEVVGVNARGIRGADGMGFSIPATVAQEISRRLIKEGTIERAWLGLRFMDDREANLGWNAVDGPMITLIEPEGSAAKLGFEVGDTLIKLNGNRVSKIDEIGLFLRTVAPGTPITLTYRRGDKDTQVTLTLSTRPHDAELEHSAHGLWVALSAAQQERARRFGHSLSLLDQADLQDPWTTYQSGAMAVLRTEFLALAELAWVRHRADASLTPDEISKEMLKHQGTVTVQIDLPTKWKLGPTDQLWAEWRDNGGTTRALSVEVVSNAPPGFVRLLVHIQSPYIEKTDAAVLVLHLDKFTDRRFVFNLNQIH